MRSAVAPAQAGAHNHRTWLLKQGRLPLCPFRGPRRMGPGLRRGDSREWEAVAQNNHGLCQGS